MANTAPHEPGYTDKYLRFFDDLTAVGFTSDTAQSKKVSSKTNCWHCCRACVDLRGARLDLGIRPTICCKPVVNAHCRVGISGGREHDSIAGSSLCCYCTATESGRLTLCGCLRPRTDRANTGGHRGRYRQLNDLRLAQSQDIRHSAHFSRSSLVVTISAR